MREDLALDVKIGDTVYNCFSQPLTVKDKTVFYTNEDKRRVHCIKFVVSDEQNNTHSYECEDVYFKDLSDEDDAEQSWVSWASDNKDFFDVFDHISTIKEIYKTGFAEGFIWQRKCKAQEQLQK